MFKSILPTRRIPSDEFTIITPLADDLSAKENMPVSVSVLTKGRSSSKPAEKKKRLELKKTKDLQVIEPPLVSPHAFDKLLVRLYTICRRIPFTQSS